MQNSASYLKTVSILFTFADGTTPLIQSAESSAIRKNNK